MKKTILSFLRRLNGTERNLQKISQLEQQIIKLNESTEIFCSSLEKKSGDISDRVTEIYNKFIESDTVKTVTLDTISANIDNNKQTIQTHAESIVNILKHQEELIKKNYSDLTRLVDSLQNDPQVEKISSKIDFLVALGENSHTLLKCIEPLRTTLENIQELCTQSIYNLISISSISENQKKFLYIPGGSQKNYIFSVIDEKLTFASDSKTRNDSLPPIFIISNMKSGTYLLGKILSELGFQDVNVHASDNVFTDHLNRSIEDQLNYDLDYLVGLPFELQVQCVSGGQFLLGHIAFRYAPLLENRIFFCCARDLRFVCVSVLRFNQRRKFFSDTSWFDKGATEEALFLLLNDDVNAGALVYFAQNILQWVEKFPESLIRYENLIDESAELHMETLEKIASSTGKDVLDVVKARKNALGQQTHSYSGKPSTLDGMWSKRVEEKFMQLGLHEINAALGYPREWTHENYPHEE